tara:strand:- start:2901 stop:4229 length:1329 start_codon:yes stop_codon:yes gene_type:complete
MANLADLEKHNLQLNPVNSISSGVYSPSSGLPLIKFDISSTEMPTSLDLSQLRISGNVTYKSGGAQVTATNAVYRDGFSGDINNCIEHVTISSKKLNSVLERVTNYSRMIPTIISGQHGPSDINCQLWNEAGHCVNNFLARNVVIAQEAARGKSFCAPLYCGIFNSGGDLDISQFGTGGLTIEILLKPNVSGAFGADAAGANPVQYELSNLLLTCPALRASGSEAQSMIQSDRVFNFNSITSIFQTLNSSASVVAVTPGLQNVSSVFMNAINTQDLGNQLRNSARLSNMGQLRELRFSKNGVLHPNQYRLFSDVQQNNVVSALNAQTLKGREMIDKNYFEALSTNPIGQFGKTMVAYNNFEDGIKNRTQTQNNGGSSLGTCSGAGVLFDAYGNGEDFSNTVFSAEFDNSTLDGTAASTLGLYLFFLNKQSLIMSPQGISVNK